MTGSVGSAPDHEVVIVGAGFSGLGAALHLKRAGKADFVVLERSHGVGGVWRDNTYPGVAVDVPSFLYSFAFEPADWSRFYAPGDELREYGERCAEKHRLLEHIHFGVVVIDASFDEGQDMWRVRTNQGEVRCRYLIPATGGFSHPRWPNVPGLEMFEGDLVHTARWDPNLRLEGRRVALVGTGASAVQLLPRLVEQGADVVVFQRTAPWILPKLLDRDLGRCTRAVLRRVRPLHRLARFLVACVAEVVLVLLIAFHRQVPVLRRLAEAHCRARLRRQVPDPTLRAALTPGYPLGCKRPLFSNDYWRTVARPEVQLVPLAVAKATRTGLVTSDGRLHAVDVIVAATGFKVLEYGNTPAFTIIGLDGVDLGRFWEEHRYQAYEGTSVPQAPNLWMVLGPYAFSGSSWFGMIDYQMAHALRCMQAARDVGATRVTVRHAAHDHYFQKTLRRQRNAVFFSADCSRSNSDLFDRHGDVPILRPALSLEAAWRGRHVPLRHYEFSRAWKPVGR